MGIFTCQILFHGQDLSLKGAIKELTDQVNRTKTKAHMAAGEIKGLAKKIKDLKANVKKLKDKQ